MALIIIVHGNGVKKYTSASLAQQVRSFCLKHSIYVKENHWLSYHWFPGSRSISTAFLSLPILYLVNSLIKHILSLIFHQSYHQLYCGVDSKFQILKGSSDFFWTYQNLWGVLKTISMILSTFELMLVRAMCIALISACVSSNSSNQMIAIVREGFDPLKERNDWLVVLFVSYMMVHVVQEFEKKYLS